MTSLDQCMQLPAGVLDAPASALHRLLRGPTLIHLPGRQPAPLFVTVLSHGNEVTGLLAIQRVLRTYHGRELPRALSVFFANVDAARANVRRLPGQPDYNRVWPGTCEIPCAETRLMATVVDAMRVRAVFASVDLHNNTGLNPHYACVNSLAPRNLQLASLFGRTVVYFRTPVGTQSAAMTALCPAVTLECGKPGEPHGVEHAAEFVEACLHLTHIPDHAVAEGDIHLFRTMARVRIAEGVAFGFGSGDFDLTFVADLERMNFREVPAGTVFARYAGDARPALIVTDDSGEDVAADYFVYAHEALTLRRAVMPSMLTLDTAVIRQDCLCYLMERMPALDMAP